MIVSVSAPATSQRDKCLQSWSGLRRRPEGPRRRLALELLLDRGDCIARVLRKLIERVLEVLARLLDRDVDRAALFVCLEREVR